MKENISIIFAAIIGTFLIVILPLYSILDRQDSMSYNVVLTETTNFVDNIRNNGFIDKKSYIEYISAIASTSNTYKVTIEAYRNVLIHETNDAGEIIQDTFVVEKELYNTKDILEVLENESNLENLDSSNIKNNVYLLNEDDEVYVRVHNTNITSGSILYSLIAGITNNVVIDISYGGVVNNVNWELYNKLQADSALMPEVVMSVPVNEKGDTNVQKTGNVDQALYIACTTGKAEEYIMNMGLVDTSVEDLCQDVTDEGNYAYIYDLAEAKNETIRIAVELRRFDKLDIGTTLAGYTDTYARLEDISPDLFSGAGQNRSYEESYIIKNYIKLNGMYANVDLKLRPEGDYYFFDIILTDVHMSSLDYISTRASVAVLAGLGEDANGIPSLAGETVEIELYDQEAVNTVMISVPHIWNKLLKTKSLNQSRILDNVVYAKEDLAFVISYTGINGHTDEEIAEAIKQNLKILIDSSVYSGLEIYTEEQLNETYGINIATQLAGHVLVKFRYESENESSSNYLKLPEGWIHTVIENVEDPESEEKITLPAFGTESVYYQVLSDTSAPLEPIIALEGVQGNDGWYISDVVLNLLPSPSDTVLKNNVVRVGGSGVDKNTLILSGAIIEEEKEIKTIDLTTEGTTYVVAKAYDYIGNVVETAPQTIKIDKTAPTMPTVKLTGTKGENNWFTSNVSMEIIPGTDNLSGVSKVTYAIEGANAIQETEGLNYMFSVEGRSKVTVTTYDNAGNKSQMEVEVNIDKSKPQDAAIQVVEGEKHSKTNDWYYTDVKLRVTVDASNSVSGLGSASYKITGDSNVGVTKFEGNTKDIVLDKNGTHEVTVYTYNVAGNVNVTTYTVNIDKDSPNEPTIKVIKGTEGENNWYVSNVELSVISNGDAGTSKEKYMTYTIRNNGTTSIEKEISSNTKLFFNEEGEYTLTVYSTDNALNRATVQKVIKIDKTTPKPANFVISGTKGIDEWYISDVNISYKGEADTVSGINSVELSTSSITENTAGEEITLTTKDNAGNKVTKTVTIKLDKSVPTDPVINISEKPTGDTGDGVTLAYNKEVHITITPGVDTFLTGKSNQDKTTYEVIKNDGTTLVAETAGTSLDITEEGIITITARTYDKAGNVSTAAKTLWIDKSTPATPVVSTINGVSVLNDVRKEVNSTSGKLVLTINKLQKNNTVKITLINQSTYEKIEVIQNVKTNVPIEIDLAKKGKYSIIVTQTNMFGTTSSESTGRYYYTYE